MFRAVLNNSSKFSVGLIGIIVFLLGEALLLFSVSRIGVVYTILLFVTLSFPISLALQRYYSQMSNKSKTLTRINSWIPNLENKINSRYVILAKTSKVSAVFVSAALSGVFVTAIFIQILGYRGQQSIMLLLMANVVFYSLWSLVYGGFINLTFFLLK